MQLYRADVVGSMLRPAYLLEAREQHNAVPDDKVVVLGLITTKWPREETAAELTSRIKEASAYVPLGRLALSPQCGFASVAEGNAVSPQVQEKKLRLVAEVARAVWPD